MIREVWPRGDVTFKRQKTDYLLAKEGYEGGLSPQADGGWRWWLRAGANRFAGSAASQGEAQGIVSTLVNLIDNGEDPEFYLETLKE